MDPLQLSQSQDEIHTEEEINAQASFEEGLEVPPEKLLPDESIDFVLVWIGKRFDPSIDYCTSDALRREVFLRNLRAEGLKIGFDRLEGTDYLCAQIHAPFDVLIATSELLKLRMPIKEEFQLVDEKVETETALNGVTRRVFNWIFCLPDLNRSMNNRVTAVYSRDKEYLFDIREVKNFFIPSIRGRIIDFLLRRAVYQIGSIDGFGIDRLLADKVYYAAYPLHDGDIETSMGQRKALLSEWGSYRQWYNHRHQPLNKIKEYFGVKITLYFAWLGCYTSMLMLPAIVGFCCFLYGIVTVYYDQYSNDFCKKDSGIKVCPRCTICLIEKLEDSCTDSRLTYIFDNEATVLFAFFMSLWAAFFLQYWKRYLAELKYRWDLTDFDVYDENLRPEYLALLKKWNLNDIYKASLRNNGANEETIKNTPTFAEPRIWYWTTKLKGVVLIILSICINLSVVFLIITSRIILSAKANEKYTDKGLLWFISATGTFVNVCVIKIFSRVYKRISKYLTNREPHRTQTEYDNSLTFKIYTFSFINNYAALVYVAFFKGQFVGHPSRYISVFDHRQEECATAGCMADLWMALAGTMIFKRIKLFGSQCCVRPGILRCTRKCKAKHKAIEKIDLTGENVPQWAKDLNLFVSERRALLSEYRQMVMYYGFATLFVAAFPLAPLVLFLFNMFEIRVDARKLLIQHRRPVAQRVKNIGIWYKILNFIGDLAVLSNGKPILTNTSFIKLHQEWLSTNVQMLKMMDLVTVTATTFLCFHACIIAFTSNFVPKFYYRFFVYKTSDSRYGTLNGFLNHSLTIYNTSDIDIEKSHHSNTSSTCAFSAYRYGHTAAESQRYNVTEEYWKVFLARVAFVVIYENIVAMSIRILKWIYPEVSKNLQLQARKESYRLTDLLIRENRPAASRRFSS